MIHCEPKSVLSWNFELSGNDFKASVKLNRLKEEGTILLNNTTFTVQKNGLFKGQWSLLKEGQEIASAIKTAALFRAFEVKTSTGDYEVIAESSMKRSFLIKNKNKVIGSITPNSAFTRKARIEMEVNDSDAQLVVFAFWLTIMMWRRASRSG